MFELFERTVKSYFGQEQEELEEAIGYLSVPMELALDQQC
jgi:hypothetical protein